MDNTLSTKSAVHVSVCFWVMSLTMENARLLFEMVSRFELSLFSLSSSSKRHFAHITMSSRSKPVVTFSRRCTRKTGPLFRAFAIPHAAVKSRSRIPRVPPWFVFRGSGNSSHAHSHTSQTPRSQRTTEATMHAVQNSTEKATNIAQPTSLRTWPPTGREYPLCHQASSACFCFLSFVLQFDRQANVDTHEHEATWTQELLFDFAVFWGVLKFAAVPDPRLL